MKKAIDICKVVAKEKVNTKVWVLTAGKEDIFLYTSRNKEVKYFHNLKAMEPVEEKISFLIDPYTLEEALKGKQKVKEWEISEDKKKLIIEKEIPVKGTKDVTFEKEEIEIEWFEGKFPIEKMNFKEMNNAEEFLEMIETINNVSGKTAVNFTMGGGEMTVRSPLYIKRFTLQEDMPSCTMPIAYLSLLKSNLLWRKTDKQKTLSYFGKEGELVIKTELCPKNPEDHIKQLFVFKQSNDLVNVKRIDGEIVHTFKIESDLILSSLKQYKKPVVDVYLYDLNGQLCIDPYDKKGEPVEEDEDQPIFLFDYEGNVKRTKVDLEGIISFLEGHVGEIAIDIKKFEEEEEEYYLLSSKSSRFYSVLMAKKEPNYKKIQEKVDRILEEQKKIPYL
jgi:hypothetical protein